MKQAAVERDGRMHTISMVRRGKPELLFPQLYTETWQRSIVANWIDATAREFAEMIAPLPTITCSSGAMKTQADKSRAGLRNKIAQHYIVKSNLKSAMFGWADAYLTFGFAVLVVEPDYDGQTPRLRTMSSIGSYYRNDRYGNTLEFAHCTKETVDKLAGMFPEFEGKIRTKLDGFGGMTLADGNEKLEVVEYADASGWRLFLPQRSDLVLASYANVLDRCPVRVAERPSIFGEPVGQYDDVVWVQMARHRIALLALEAGTKAVGAPLAVPRDVSELAIGPDAVIVSESPEKIRRVGIEVPQSAFALQQTLEQELRIGARYPEGRNGGIDASVITGRGVQALMGSFDTQISVAQSVIGECLARSIEMAFEMDAKVWPSTSKQVTGSYQGEPYDFTYVAGKAIGTAFSCEVTYGFASGLAPNAAAVMLLQLRGDRLIDRATVQRNLPFAIDPEQMQRNIDVEETADALKQGLFGLLQGLGPMAAQGQDPRPFLRVAAEIIQGRQNGKPLEDLFVTAFSPQVMADPAAAQQGQDPTGAPPQSPGGGGQALPGQDPTSGLPSGITPGQAGMPAGGAPDLQTLIAGMRHGNVQMDAAVSRRLPAGP